MSRVETIQSLAEVTSVLGERGQSTADIKWTVEDLDKEILKLRGLEDEARLEVNRQQERRRVILYLRTRGYEREKLEGFSDERLDKLEDKELAIQAQEQAEAEEKQAKEAEERKAVREAAEAKYRAERQRLIAERQAEYERANAERLERERIEREIEAQWQPIKHSAPVRGSSIVLNLMPGEKIRPHRGGEVETYVERTGAGYSTNRYTHPDLRRLGSVERKDQQCDRRLILCRLNQLFR